MPHTIELHTPDGRSGIPPQCEVDLDSVPEGYGGFGTVYPVLGNSQFVAKRIAMGSPQPLGDLSTYTVHVTETRSRLQEILRSGAQEFPKSMMRDVLDSLAMGWSVELAPDGRMTALWFLQRRARGNPLQHLFRAYDSPPPVSDRLQIARGVVGLMRALRRADLVHLDCVDDNIFADMADSYDGKIRVTLIDLDGSGVIKRGLPGSQSDKWTHKPLTLGHLSSTRVPPWYPQPFVDAGPLSGNYLYAERWVVLDTIIRILTWNRLDSLSWLHYSACNALSSAYHEVTALLETDASRGVLPDIQIWQKLWRSTLNDTARAVGPLPEFAPDPEAPQVTPFVRLAKRAYFDPAELSSHRLSGNSSPPYAIFLDWLR